MGADDMRSAKPGGVRADVPPPSSRIHRGRRRLLKGTVAIAGGVALAAYTRPTLRPLGVPVALAVSAPPEPVQGSPGFWKDGGKGQTSLWDSLNDVDWKDWAQKLGLAAATPANPFVKTDPFTSVFATHPAVSGYTMQQLLDGVKVKDATALEEAVRQAARSLVAAYLDASLYGAGYAYTQAQLKGLWQQAVTTNTKDAFETLKTTLEATYN